MHCIDTYFVSSPCTRSKHMAISSHRQGFAVTVLAVPGMCYSRITGLVCCSYEKAAPHSTRNAHGISYSYPIALLLTLRQENDSSDVEGWVGSLTCNYCKAHTLERTGVVWR